MASPREKFNAHIVRQLRLRDLHILATVVQWGSMAKAATHLGVSQPSISQALVGLENSLGVRLLDRHPQGAEPTRYAHALLKRSAVIFDELTEALAELEHLSDPSTGEVRIGCPDSLAAGFVPAVISELLRHHPRVLVRVVSVERAAPEFRELRERTLDLMFGRIIKPFMAEDLETEILFHDQLRVVAGENSRWARQRNIQLAELVNEPWILFPPNNVVSSFAAEAFEAHGLELPHEAVNTFSLLVRNHLLTTGRFLTMGWSSMLQFNSERWSLKALPVELNIASVPVGIFTLKNRTLGPVAQLFVDTARAVAQSMDMSPARRTRPAPRQENRTRHVPK